MKGYYYWRCKFCRPWLRNTASWWLQIVQKLETRQRRHSLLTWRHLQLFIDVAVLLLPSYWSKFHVNIMTGSGVMTIFVYEQMTRNPEIGNALVCLLLNTWILGQVNNTKVSMNFSQGKTNRDQRGVKITPHPPILIRIKRFQLKLTHLIFWIKFIQKEYF